MVLHLSLSNSESPQVSRTLLGILADLNNAVLGFHSFFSLCTNCLVAVPRAPITVGIIVTFMFHIFFSSLARSRYLSLFPHSFSFSLRSAKTAKPPIWQFLFFVFCCWLSVGLVDWPKLGDLFVSQKLKKFVRLIFEDGFRLLHIPFVRKLKFKHLAQFRVGHLTTHLYPALYSLCTNLLHSLIMGWIVSSLSPYILYPVYSCFDIVSPYGVVLCYYQKRFRFSLKVSIS